MKNVETQMGQLAQFVRGHSPKSFPSDTETNPKQCMVVTLRSGKELDEPKNVEKDENQVQWKILEVEKEKGGTEIEEKLEAKIRVNNKGEQQKYDEVVRGRMDFSNDPPLNTPPLPFP